MSSNILEKISKQHLLEYIDHCAKYAKFDQLKMYELTLATIKMHQGADIQTHQVKEIVELEAQWYAGLAVGKPDYSVYSSPYYFADIWSCWVNYSRKYLKQIQTPESMVTKSIVEDMGAVQSVVDLGCGFGYTCAGWKSIYPNAKVVGTNFYGTAQYNMATDLAQIHGFQIAPNVKGIKADLVFASEYFEHIQNPIAHLHKVINECQPRLLLIANTFNSTSIGHFKQYEYKGVQYSGSKMSRMFNDALRHYGYEKIKTKCWNQRPTYWKKVK